MILPRFIADGRRRARLAVLFCLLCCAAPAADAQSGRRSPTVKSPSPVETPAPAPTPKPKTADAPALKPEIFLKIVSSVPPSMRLQLPFPERMTGWVTERLRNSALLEISSGGDGRHKEAQTLAKNSEGPFVVLLELNENPFVTDAYEARFWIEYAVYTPGTAKIKRRGRAELRPELLRRGTILDARSECYPTLRREEYLLLAASYEAAERIMADFDLPIPPVKCR